MIRKGPVYQASGGYPPASYQSPQQLQSNFNGPGHQHQGPASQQHPQQQAGGSVNGNTDGQSNSASGAQPEMNLASVLHYLQSEWRRWERDRNEWEIERAEMRVGSAGQQCIPRKTADADAPARVGEDSAAGRAETVGREPQGRSHASGQDAGVCFTAGEVGWTCSRRGDIR
jgi:striatin 1/3/4